jgi:hypothetical protein
LRTGKKKRTSIAFPGLGGHISPKRRVEFKRHSRIILLLHRKPSHASEAFKYGETNFNKRLGDVKSKFQMDSA